MKHQTLPPAKIEDGKLILSEPYKPGNRITCTPYGEMSDGSLVWESETGKQYIRIRKYGKYYFLAI